MPGFDNGVMYADNVDFTGGTPVTGKVTTDGQLLIGSTAAPHVKVGTLSSSDSSIAITAGSGTIDIKAGAGVPLTFAGDSGTATPALNTITISGGTALTSVASGSTVTINADATIPTSFAGDSGTATPSSNTLTISGGTGLTSTASGSTVTVNLDTPVSLANGGTNANLTASNGGVFYSTSTAGAILSGTATANQALLSGSSTTPAWSTTTYPTTTAQGDVVYASAANTLSTLTKNTSATRYVSNTGTSNNPAWAQVDLTNGVTGVLPIANGGSGSSSSMGSNPLKASTVITGTNTIINTTYGIYSGAALTATRTVIYFMQIYINNAMTYTKLGHWQSAGGTSTIKNMYAIYDSTGTGGIPGNVLTSVIDVTNGGTGSRLIEGTISWAAPSPGWYWFGYQYDSSTQNINLVATLYTSNLFVYDTASLTTSPTAFSYLTYTNTYGTFPTNPTGFGYANSGSNLFVYIR